MTRGLFTSMLGMLFVGLSFPVFGQAPTASLSATAEITPSINKELALVNPSEEEWTYYLNKEKRSYFIDFEAISVNLTEVVLRDGTGETLFTEKVDDLPVDAIYEIDLADYPAGTYSVEIKSYINSTRRTFVLD